MEMEMKGNHRIVEKFLNNNEKKNSVRKMPLNCHPLMLLRLLEEQVK
jgi:hypothetical protein